MRKKKTSMIALIAGAILVLGIVLGIALWGTIVSNVEQAKYTVVTFENTIEIREYAPMIVAQVSMSGTREIAINKGFMILADYIFGNNVSKTKISMTAPVIQKTHEKISMTAPVTQQGNENEWIIRFVMPYHYTLETLPKPNNTMITLKQMPHARFAVIRFSGIATQDSIENHENDLISFINKKGLKIVSTPTYAFFNPPWTLPLLRRNEVMVEIMD